jgi:hypothetical protein
MAWSVLEAGIVSLEHDSNEAIDILKAPKAPEDYPSLFDVTDAVGGWAIWCDYILDDARPPVIGRS